MKPILLLVVLAASSVAVAQETSQPTPPATQFVTACLSQGATLNTTTEQCESFMVRSRVIQSDALRYLTPIEEKQREKFAALPTKDRFDLVESGADMTKLVSVVLKEVGTEGLVVPAPDSHVAAHIVGDVMKPNCGPYQLDMILRTVDSVVKETPVRAKVGRNAKQPPKKVETACIVSDESTATVDEDLKRCLSGIFQLGDQSQRTASAILEPSPNP